MKKNQSRQIRRAGRGFLLRSAGVWACLLGIVGARPLAPAQAAENSRSARELAERWRAERRITDLHEHLDYTPEALGRAIKVLNASGIGLAVDLTPGTVTRGPNGEPSEFERHKQMEDALFPGRWLQYMNLDYRNWEQPDFAQQSVRQVEEGYRLGAAGFKEWKRLGLFLRDGKGDLIAIDDPKLDPMWQRLGELNMPVSIHLGDPKAFFEPYTEKNERWKELKDHPSWWFGDTNKFPTFHGLLEGLSRVIARHPHTTFVCVHFGNNAEELDWVDQSLAKYPNMMVDLAARIPELGRHDPSEVHRMFVKYQDRIFFGTDFQSLNGRMILGSSGKEPPPSVADAEVFFRKEYRWLETWDKNWPHMTPIQGDWTISSIGLPASVLRKIYFDNARHLLARSLPLPVVQARRISQDFQPNGELDEEVWRTVEPVMLEYTSKEYSARPDCATTVRVLWSDDSLYIAWEGPYSKLTVFDSPQQGTERFDMETQGVSLWDRDVVEVMIASDPGHPNRYAEFEVAPTNEKLDLLLDLPKRDFAWSSGFQTAVTVDKKARRWICEARIPMKALAAEKPKLGAKWRVNFYRCDRAAEAALAWNPTLRGTFHKPDKFGVLEFAE